MYGGQKMACKKPVEKHMAYCNDNIRSCGYPPAGPGVYDQWHVRNGAWVSEGIPDSVNRIWLKSFSMSSNWFNPCDTFAQKQWLSWEFLSVGFRAYQPTEFIFYFLEN